MGNKYIEAFERELATMTKIESILQQHQVKCSDWIGLVEKIGELVRSNDKQVPQ